MVVNGTLGQSLYASSDDGKGKTNRVIWTQTRTR